MALDNYSHLKEDVLKCIDDMLAIDGKLSGSDKLLEKSFLPGFEKILNNFLPSLIHKDQQFTMNL